MASQYIPKDGLAGLKENWKTDVQSGLMVSFLALPLCLGIASASKFPPVTGLFTAIIGGVVVAMLAGSRLTVKGPAAGLIAIALGSVETLGYQKTLAIIVVASIAQIFLGLLKTGKLGDFFPISVIHGMLAAIGVIIFSKQIHVLLGVTPEAKEPLELIAEIPHSIMNARWEVALVGMLSLFIIFALPLVKNAMLKKIPAPMLVLLVAVPLGLVLGLDKMLVNDKAIYLVNIPTSIMQGILDFDISKMGLTFPDFSEITSAESLQYIVMFALIGSIESLLTVKAIDGMDKYQRKSDMNRDIVAVGIGNALVGFIGGLPMISEVARSSANVANGAKTRWANFFHGLSILLFVLLFAKIIILIPMAALAAMLIAVAYRLASPNEFIHTYHIGKEQLVIFLTTLLVTLATDLLIGVGIGILVKIGIELFYGLPAKAIFKSFVTTEQINEDTFSLKVAEAANFSNYLSFKKHLEVIPKKKRIIIDMSKAKIIDHSFMENLHHFESEYHQQGGSVEIVGMEHQKALSEHPLCVRIFDATYKETNATLLLDNRQKELSTFAEKEGFTFKPQRISDSFRYLIFVYFQGKKIHYRENRLVKKINDTIFEFSDMYISEMSNLSGKSYKMTALTVTDVLPHLPFFRLEKEGLLDKFSQLVGYEDIDFNEYPIFSEHYLLKSPEVEATKKLFTPTLISFLEKYKDNPFTIRSRGSRLLLVKDERTLTAAEMEEALEIMYGFVEILKKEQQISQKTLKESFNS
ncbi:MAG: SulP family inorganic anion transporter [Thermonemataceae bacterium]|nr:SulP family inorganic anion transporter [Thermonemataceae bacterium]